MAYVPIYGDGIHGRNPNPGHLLSIFDLNRRAYVGDIDLRPYIAPHTLKLGPDGLIYLTCENSAVVAVIDPATNKVIDAIDSGSTNGHRLIIAPDGKRLYTENEEDGTVSVIDLPARKLLGKIKTPEALAGITISKDGRTPSWSERRNAVAFPDRCREKRGDTQDRTERRAEAGADRAL